MAVGTAAGELRNLTQEELVTRLREYKEELFNLRFQGATGQLEKSRSLARGPQGHRPHLHDLRERELGITPMLETTEDEEGAA
jgi:large subunit ribosomal protein L29